LIGASGSGKSTFARRHFKETEILSSDFYRGVVSDDENDQGATSDAFAVLHYVLEKRLAARRLTVVDSPKERAEDRKNLVELARRYHALSVAIVFDLPEALCHERNAGRPNRQFGRHVVHKHVRALRQSLRNLERERFRYVHVLKTPEQVDAAVVERQRLWTDRRDDSGPFDIIGDIHGCATELEDLLRTLGYQIDRNPDHELHYRVAPPPGRRAIFVGDLVDRGPRVPDVLRLVMSMVAAGQALCVLGNHEVKLQRKLAGRDVKLTHGLAQTMEQLVAEPPELQQRTTKFIDGLISHYLLDGGKLAVAHAGVKEGMQGRSSGAVREFCLYGETTGEVDEYGLPVRYNWANDYRGRAKVVYGHTPVPEAEWFNGTICLDTGCVFGGKLTALRYPEMELVSVPARQVYYESAKPLGLPAAASAQQQHDDMIDLADVQGRRVIETTMMGRLTLREENATAALEVMSRFAIDPHWLIYLPPTMSPSETSQREGLLEHPEDAFAYFREHGATQVVCEEKHMGSRAIAIVCRDTEIARKRFAIDSAAGGVIYTRTGRPFFTDEALEAALLDRLRQAATRAGWWEKLDTGWVCLDAELMPWSAKAQALLQQQYAPVGLAAELGLGAAVGSLKAASERGVPLGSLLDRVSARADMAHAYRDAYRRYCWPVAAIDDLRLAPFHLLASENAVHTDKDHPWHMETLRELCDGDPVLQRTVYRSVDLADETAVADAIAWWEALTERGGEGMVVKPIEFVTRGSRHGLLQPALKCRGREYLRIIYGLDYTAPENLERLRRRGLGRKRSLAQREFALGLTALDRFVRREPLRLVHECVFGILALESEPVDPRL